MSDVRRITRSDYIRECYYKLPKFLWGFKGLSSNAKILYALLKERHELSVKNNWVNENGEIFLVYTRKDMQEMLDVSEMTTMKAVKELKFNNLLEEERQGLGKPNKIYLLTISEQEKLVPQNPKIYGSATTNNAGLPINKKKKSKTELSSARAENERSSFDLEKITEMINKK